MALTPDLLPSLYEELRLVYFLINIFMMDYDLNPMSWVKSHICDFLVWKKSTRNFVDNFKRKKKADWPDLMVCAAVFPHSVTLMDS